MVIELPRRFPTAPSDSLTAAVLLSFLATAGFYYVNIMPAMVDGLIGGLHFSERNAGLVASANVYGAALGALVAVLIVKRIHWRKTAVDLLFGLIAMDLASMLMRSVELLIVTRFIDGVIGGLLVGIAFAVIARTRNPDRVFGVLLLVQFGFGGLGVMCLPRLVPHYGVAVVFAALIVFSVMTLLMLPFLGDYPMRGEEKQERAEPRGRIEWLPLLLALASTFLFQAGNMILASYIIGLGRAFGLNTVFISYVLGIASWIGATGSILVIGLGTRLGRFWPVLIAFVPTLIGCAAFHFSSSGAVYAAANIGTAITWAFIIPYLLGMCASFDKTGQMAALASFISHVGLATGPLIGGLLLGQNNYSLLINVAVVSLVLSALTAMLPARRLDRLKQVVASEHARSPS